MPKEKTIRIKGGTVVLGHTVACRDILFKGEVIQAVGNLSGIAADEEINAEGLLVLPGAVDTHVHFDDVFMGTVSVHDYYTGTKAAAHGGVTAVIDFSNQIPEEPLIRTINAKKEAAEGKAVIDWGVHPVITNAAPEILDEIPLLVKEGAPSIKCYMTYREDGLLVEQEDLMKISARLHKEGGMLMVHAEDDAILAENITKTVEAGNLSAYYHSVSRPPEAEINAIKNCVNIARETGGRLFIVHLSAADGMQIIGSARAKGIDIMAETCTHYLVFTEEILRQDDGIKWICSPPLRNKDNQDRLWSGIGDGRIAMVSSDDAAYSWEAKLMGKDRFDRCPNGIAGIEARFSVLYSEGVAKNRISLPRFVELVSTAPARLFGLAPKKGSLTPGSDADIVLFNPEKKWTMNRNTLHMATDYAAYDGIEITGKIEKVFSRGEMILDEDRLIAEKGRGKYLHRKLDFSNHS